MTPVLCSLVVFVALSSVKAEMAGKYPEYSRQIQQVGIPSIEYRKHMPFSWHHLAWLKGKCDLHAKPQVMVVKDRKFHITQYRLRHELCHFVIFAAGLPDGEHRNIDNRK